MAQNEPAWWQQPQRILPGAFLLAMIVGGGLLTLPIAHHAGQRTNPLAALFTATSAVCVTGLSVVDTEHYWSGFGKVVILILIQIGGFGITALASLLVVLTRGKLGLRTRLLAQAESRSMELGGVGRLLLRIAGAMAVFEGTATVILSLRFWLYYDNSLPRAMWYGLFHAVSAFNNAGFSVFSANMVDYRSDPFVVLTIAGAIVIGATGFPVLFELRRSWRTPKKWSIHTRLTLIVHALLLTVGFFAILGFEWTNPGTLGPMSIHDKVLSAIFHSVQPRTAGFNTIDVGAQEPATLLVTIILMFIGGGSAGTAGGVKMTTAAVLFLLVRAEVRGREDSTVFHRRLSRSVQREALSIFVLATTAVGIGSLLIMTFTNFGLDVVVFEAVSAFATVGLSTGITASLAGAAQVVLIILMFIGRVGPVSAAAFLALRQSDVRYRYPEATPLVG